MQRYVRDVPSVAWDLMEIADKPTTVILDGAAKVAPSVLKVFKTLKTGRACDAAPGTLKVEHAHLFVATADQWLEIIELQAAGKKRMAARDFLNGFKGVEEFEVK